MALIGGTIHCDLRKTTEGHGTRVSPYTAEQLGTVLNAATGLSSSVTVLVRNSRTLTNGAVLDWSTPNLVSGDSSLILKFKRHSNAEECPVVYCEDGMHTHRFLIKIGGGNFKTIFSDVLTHVRGDLNATLESLIEVIGSNQVFLGNAGLVANNLSNFKSVMGGGSFLPVFLSNPNIRVYENTLVVDSANPQILVAPGTEKFLALVNNMVVLGNVAFGFLFPTTTSTKAERNFFLKIPGTSVEIDGLYETSVLSPTGAADFGNFTDNHSLANVTGDKKKLNLNFKKNGTNLGSHSISKPSDFNVNYPFFSDFSNKGAGYTCVVKN